MRRRDFYLHEYAKPMELDERMEKVLKLISNYKGKVRKFLDIGCGDGSFTLLLKEALGADEVYGVDISPEGCKLAQQKSIKCFCIDIDEVEKFPFEDESFDFIHAGQILEHLFDTDHLLEEIHRLLKAGSFAIISVPNLASWYNRISLLLGFQPINTAVSLKYFEAGKISKNPNISIAGREHLRVGTLKSYKELFKKHMFIVRKVYGVSVTRKGINPFILFIDKLLSLFTSMASVLIFIVVPAEYKRKAEHHH